MIKATSHAVFLGAVLAGAACGSTTSQSSSGDAPVATATAQPTASAAPVVDEKRLAEHRQTFLGECQKGLPGAPEYCDCAWGEMAKSFTVEEMNADEIDPVKFKAFDVQVKKTCAAKIPEEVVRKGFLTGCVGDRTEMGGYCECTWTEFRKKFQAHEFTDEAFGKSATFQAERPAVVKTCGPKYPEASAKKAFMTGCAKDPKAEKFCSCAWTEVRKLAQPAEIDAGLLADGWQPKVEKTCGKLRPKEAAPKDAPPKDAPPANGGPAPKK